MSLHSCVRVKGGHWVSNPDTSLAGDSESTETAPAHRRHRRRHRRHHTARTWLLYLGWHRCTLPHAYADTNRCQDTAKTWHRQHLGGGVTPYYEAEGFRGSCRTMPAQRTWRRKNEAQEWKETIRVAEKALCSSERLGGGAKLRYLHWDNR